MNDKKNKQTQQVSDVDSSLSDHSPIDKAVSAGTESAMKKSDQTPSETSDRANVKSGQPSANLRDEKHPDPKKKEEKKGSAVDSNPPNWQKREPPALIKPQSSKGTPGWLTGLIVIGLVGVGVLTWWQEQRINDVSRLVATRLSGTETQMNSMRQLLQSTNATVSAQEDAVQALRRDVQFLKSEVAGFDQMWQNISRGLDDRMVINDVRRLLMMAQQQLSLSGHRTNAISILEVAQSHLRNQPDSGVFADLNDAIGRDLDELRALPVVNVNALSNSLKRVVSLIETAPLMMPDHQVPNLPIKPSTHEQAGVLESEATESAEPDLDQAWWKSWANQTLEYGQRATQVLSKQFSNLVEVRHADDPVSLLMTDQQALLLRNNVHSMLLTAQLAMLTQENSVWVGQLESVEQIVQTYYDTQAVETQRVLEELKRLRNTSVEQNTGSVAQSLSALAIASQLVKTTADSGESHQ